MLEVKRIHADAAIVSLLHLAPVIDAVEIDAPTVRVSRLGDGRYDVDDVLQHVASIPRSPEPARFAIHNIVVRGGSADFVDGPLATTHRVRELELAVPFVSSLPAEREIKVEPHLAFALDGSRFDSAAAATPFAERGNGEVHLRFDGFSVAPWLGYLPRGLPVQLRAATLGADLVVAFEQRPKLSLKISGSVGASGIEVVDAAAAELLQVGSIKVQVDELRPLERRVRIKSADVDAAHVVAVRDAAGRVNLLLAAEAPSGAASAVARLPLTTSAASAAASASAASTAAPTSAVPTPWQASVAALSIRAARLDWRDATTSPAAELAVSDFSFAARAIAWPLDAPIAFSGEGTVGSAADHGKLSFSGQGTDSAATVKVDAGRFAAGGISAVSQRRPRAAAGGRAERRGRDRLARRQSADASSARCQAIAAEQARAWRVQVAGDRRPRRSSSMTCTSTRLRAARRSADSRCLRRGCESSATLRGAGRSSATAYPARSPRPPCRGPRRQRRRRRAPRRHGSLPSANSRSSADACRSATS